MRRYGIFAGTSTFTDLRRLIAGWCFDKAVDEVKIVASYERQFAEACGARHAVSFGAGRMALYAILEALGVGPGDEVIIPAFTCVVVPNAILYRGARPVFVDIEVRTFNIDVKQVEKAITPRTKALYAQHTFGVPCDVAALRDIGKRRNLPVIEDAAHALGARQDGMQAGTMTEVAFFSTDHSKVVSTHLGGMAVTNDDLLADRIRQIQSSSEGVDAYTRSRLLLSFALELLLFMPAILWIGRKIHAVLVRIGIIYCYRDELDVKKPINYPCRLSGLQARLGLSQLDNLAGNLEHRRESVRLLEREIRWYGMSDVVLDACTWLRYSFLVRDRGAVQSALTRTFDLDIWFTSVVGGREVDLGAVGYETGSCPNAEYVAEHIVNLPTHLRIPHSALAAEMSRNRALLQDNVDRTVAGGPEYDIARG